jgi:hypothetical protein
MTVRVNLKPRRQVMNSISDGEGQERYGDAGDRTPANCLCHPAERN